jgi:hypothetical protein
MSGVATAIVGAAVVSSVVSSNASSKASKVQAEAARYGADAQTQAAMYSAELQKEAVDKQIELSEPFRTAGTTAVNQLSALYGQGGEMYNRQFTPTTFTPEQFSYDQYTDPGTAFRFKEGMKAMNATAAARGGLISGNALRAGQAYGQELGSQEYQNAFNRYLANNQNRFAASQANNANQFGAYQANFANRLEPLKFLSGQGQAAAAGQAASIGAGATNIGNAMVGSANAQAAGATGAANAQAAGIVGSANAYTNALGQGISQYQTSQLLNRFAPQQTTPSYYTTNTGMNAELGL